MKWVLAFLIAITAVSAATIHGAIYDFGLDPISDALVSIDTTPAQAYVSKDGRYEFIVPKGNYTIKAMKGEQLMEEVITVADEGSYVIDLILLPDLSSEDSLLESADVEMEEIIIPDDEPASWIFYLVPLFFLIVAAIFAIRRKKSVRLDPQLQKILDFINKEGGRTTQKDIYKNLPWSESKVSLMLDELESKRLIRRVKKGRAKLVFRV